MHSQTCLHQSHVPSLQTKYFQTTTITKTSSYRSPSLLSPPKHTAWLHAHERMHLCCAFGSMFSTAAMHLTLHITANHLLARPSPVERMGPTQAEHSYGSAFYSTSFHHSLCEAVDFFTSSTACFIKLGLASLSMRLLQPSPISPSATCCWLMKTRTNTNAPTNAMKSICSMFTNQVCLIPNSVKSCPCHVTGSIG
jgi:hypothetical protein